MLKSHQAQTPHQSVNVLGDMDGHDDSSLMTNKIPQNLEPGDLTSFLVYNL